MKAYTSVGNAYAHVCSDCGKRERSPQRTIRQNLETWQGRRAAIISAHPEWATQPMPKGVPYTFAGIRRR